MKVYIKAANVADIQAKIAKKQADIDKKKALIAKRETAIDKQMKILEKYLNSDEIGHINQYIDYTVNHGTYKMPTELEIWQISRNHESKFKRDFGFADDPIYKVRDAVESIYNANRAVEEAQAILDKYQNQLNTIKQKEKQVDEIPEILKEFMNQLIDEWDRFDIEIRDNSKDFYYELKHKMDELGPTDSAIFDLYPRYKERFEKADRDRKFWIKHEMRDTFKDDYLNIPFKKKFGVSVDYAMNLWYMDDNKIHAKNVQEGKRVILDLTNRVTKITGPITDWDNLYARPGNGGWTVLNGYVVGEDGKAQVETILAGGYNVQRLHCRTLVKPIR